MINKTFRLFISSTFSDFVCERTLLNEEVFPVINEFCQNKGYSFQLIDLRWGINSESAINQKTISICLDEVERCTTLSPRPNFFIMAGERYGWIPLPYTFNTDDFDKFCKNASESEKKLLEEWYIYDENEIGGYYYLKERTDKYINDSVWSEKENELHDVIIRLAETIDDKSGKYDVYKVSATEHEIFAGLFDKLDQSKNVIALFRTGFHDKDESQEKIIKLKKRIESKLYTDGCQDNIINLRWNERYQQMFVKKTITILKKNIADEIKRLEKIKESDGLLEDELKKNNNQLEIDKDEIERILSYVNGKKNLPLFVIGESGSGKTTILSEFVCQYNNPIFYSFFGMGSRSYSLREVINDLYKKIKRKFNISISLNLNRNNITESLHDLIYSIPSKENIVIVIDGFDNFYDLDEIHETILPEKLPENVKLIVSIADMDVFNRFYIYNSPKIIIDKFNSEKAFEAIELFLSHKNRTISTTKQKLCVKNAVSPNATPLQAKLLSEICAGWRSQEEVYALPNTAEEIAYLYLTEMYKKYGHNKELFAYTMALVAVAPFGITENEILDLLLKFTPVKNYFYAEDRYNHNLIKLPFSVWSRLFYDLKGCLTLVKMNGDIVVKFVHQIFYKVIIEKFSDYCIQAQQVLKEYYYNQSNYINNDNMPNKRKALCLPILLRKNNDLKKLSELMSDLTFVDITVKEGRVDNSISDIIYLIENNETNELLLQILACLQFNEDMLSCYKGEFFSCVDFVEKSYNNCAIRNFQNNRLVKYKFFPYSKDSKISWFSSCDLMAIYHKNYVYIFSERRSRELCRIYISEKQNEQIKIVNVIWLDCNNIVVITNFNELIIYDFQDFIPNEIGRKTFDKGCVKYDIEKKMLFFIKSNHIFSINPFSLKENYRVNLGKIGKYTDVEFDIDSQNEEIIFRKKAGLIYIYSLNDGMKKKEVKFKTTLSSKSSAWVEKRILQTSKNSWFMYNLLNSEFSIYGIDNDREIFLYPPISISNVRILLGYKTMVLVNEQMIYWVDLSVRFNVYYYALGNINDFSWKNIDNELSILDVNGLMCLEKSDFKPFEQNSYCYISKKLYFRNILFSSKKTFKYIKMMLPSDNLRYGMVFDFFTLMGEFDIGIKEVNKHPTIIEYANNGIKAVAFEDRDTIVIYDGEDKCLMTISKLKLAINDNILEMEFSKDSKYLLLWRNHSVQVIDIKRTKCLLNLNIARRPVLDASFENNKIKLRFCNGEEHIFLPTQIQKSSFPKKLTEIIDEDKYVGPYKTYMTSSGENKHLTMIENLDVFRYAGDWVNNERVYIAEDAMLLLQDGEFYLNGDKSMRFDRGFSDFNKSMEIERFKDGTPKKSYLREKNDLFSKLYKLNNNKTLVLVSRMMNSVIVFDTKQLRIVGAYKHSSNIIGCRMLDNNILEINCDCYPYNFSLEIISN